MLENNNPVNDQAQSVPPTILCVDDEPQILSSLKRLFKRNKFEVLLANDGKEALDVLDEKSVDIVISDMRMPGMTGAELFAETAEKYPDTQRILLTGYSDIESSMAAINQGKIYRYLLKPWDEAALNMAVKDAMAQKELIDEKNRLEALTKKQNAELKQLNNSLEEKVKARTAELQKAATMLKKSVAKLKTSYKETMFVFNNLVHIRQNISSVNANEIADLAASMADELKLDENHHDDIYIAAILSSIGKLGLPDELLNTHYLNLNEQQKELYHEYPQIGQAILLAIPRLHSVGNIICSHRERYDGLGFPYHLKQDEISIGARILAIAYDYYAVQSGELTNKIFTKDEAYAYIQQGSETHYDPEIVSVFAKVYKNHHGAAKVVSEIGLAIEDLQESMVLTRNVTFRQGMLLLRKDQVLSKELIHKIINIKKEIDEKTIYVRPANAS